MKVTGTKTMSVSDFADFQGDLKKLSPSDEKKLASELKKDGFIAPIFIWKGHDFVIDGNQRLKVLRRLLNDGYELIIPGEAGLEQTTNELPIVEVDAINEKQAAEYILAYNSRYGKVTKEGLKDFSMTFDLDLIKLDDCVTLDFNIKSLDEPVIVEEKNNNNPKKLGKMLITCPHCGEQFSKSD